MISRRQYKRGRRVVVDYPKHPLHGRFGTVIGIRGDFKSLMGVISPNIVVAIDKHHGETIPGEWLRIIY